MFSRSIRLHKLRYNFYIGDGDSKSFNEITKLNHYPGHKIGKGECIGPVRKQVGTRLRSIKKDYKKKYCRTVKILVVAKKEGSLIKL